MKIWDHIEQAVLPAIVDYESAELALSRQARNAQSANDWQSSAAEAKRRAAQVAVALDGMVDRLSEKFSLSKNAVRTEIETSCIQLSRNGASKRVFAVANAYKHASLSNPVHPIKSWEEVLAVGTGYGTDGFGVGKNGSPEVLIEGTSPNEVHKFLGDVPAVYQAIIWFMTSRGERYVESQVIGVKIKAHP